MTIVRDDGSWAPDPSGLKSGNLEAWRNNIHEQCPNPEVGDIVIVVDEKNGKKTGYRAQTADGYDTRWQRVSSEVLERHIRMIDVKDGGDYLSDPDEWEYLCDGVYVHKDDCWF